MLINSAPKVSVCIPAYRAVEHLGSVIESVLKQTFDDFELLIIDDHSPEDITSVVESYQDPRIRYLRNEKNLGLEGNWNRCLNEARGKYFKLVCCDDLIAPDCLEKQIAVLEQDVDQHIAMVFCKRNIIDNQGELIMERGHPFAKQGVVRGIPLLKLCFLLGNIIGEPGGVMFRKALADKVGPFDGEFPNVIDLDYWARLLLHGDAYYFPEALASFRVFGGSLSIRIGADQSRQFRRFMAKIAQNPAYRITWLHLAAGNMMTRVIVFLRLIIYRLVIK